MWIIDTHPALALFSGKAHAGSDPGNEIDFEQDLGN